MEWVALLDWGCRGRPGSSNFSVVGGELGIIDLGVITEGTLGRL